MEAHSQEQKKRVCWCLSENIAKQQQLATPSPDSKVRASPEATALVPHPGQPRPPSLRIELGTSPSSELGTEQQALGKKLRASLSLACHWIY